MAGVSIDEGVMNPDEENVLSSITDDSWHSEGEDADAVLGEDAWMEYVGGCIHFFFTDSPELSRSVERVSCRT